MYISSEQQTSSKKLCAIYVSAYNLLHRHYAQVKPSVNSLSLRDSDDIEDSAYADDMIRENSTR